jgi:CheY-like chemotaxis protein
MSQAPASTVLVVDDDPLMRDVLVCALETDGYLVTAVASTMECLTLLDGGSKFDLLIIDVIMPPSMPHGFSLGRMAKHRNVGQKVLYITGVLDLLPESAIQSLDEPILAKPVRVSEFLDIVRRILASLD